MSDTHAPRLPKSPGSRRPIATQYAPGQQGTLLIEIYKHGNVYYAYADGGPYLVPSPAHDTLTVLPQAESWLYDEAARQAHLVHRTVSCPTPANASRHFLLTGLVVQGDLNFDAAWEMFCEALAYVGPDVDPDVAPTTWHREFAGQ